MDQLVGVEDPSEKFAATSSESDFSSAVAFDSPLPENLEKKKLAKLLNSSSSVLTNCIVANEDEGRNGEGSSNSITSTSSSNCTEDHLSDDNVRTSPRLPNVECSSTNMSQKPSAAESTKTNENKTRSKDNVKTKHKEDRNIEHVLKALQSLKTPEERLAALCKKYTDLLEEHRTLRLSYKMRERYNAQLLKEKEQLQTDYSKAILARSRLESLCRELQRQCKVVKEECLLRVKEEEEKRKDVSAKFQTTLTEISTLMQDNNQKNSILREENVKLSQKLKTLVDQYEIREQHIEKVLEHKKLEFQLSEAKLAKANMSIAEDKEKHLKEKQILIEELTKYQNRCIELSNNEVQLKSQLAMYTEKYSEFQDTLTKSNQVFTSFKGEMEKMSKKIKKLESETGTWKTRWENSNKAVMEMAKEKQKHGTEVTQMQKKIGQLEKLCRALQGERNSLQQHIEKLLEHKQLEFQLSEAKLATVNTSIVEEEKQLKERQKLLDELTENKKRGPDSPSNEVQLRSELATCPEKSSETQDTLTKEQIKQNHETEVNQMQKKIEQLEKQCSALQLERNTLQQQMNVSPVRDPTDETKVDELHEVMNNVEEGEETQSPPLIAQATCG